MRGFIEVPMAVTVALAVTLGATAPAVAEILGLGGKCLDLRGSRVVEGAAVILSPCKENDNESQQWTPADGKLVGPGGLCLDVGNTTAGEPPATLRKCVGGADQTWTPKQGRILHPGGVCLEARGNPDGDENPVVIAKCSDADGQRWVLQ